MMRSQASASGGNTRIQPQFPNGAAAFGAQGSYEHNPAAHGSPAFSRGQAVSSLPGYDNPTVATGAAAVAAGVEAGPDRSPAMATRAAFHPPMRLSATATAFSMTGGVSGSPVHHRETAAAATARTNGGEPGPNTAEAEQARRHGWSSERNPAATEHREVERRRGEEMDQEDRGHGGGVFAAMAATARARADEAIPANNPDGFWAPAQAGTFAGQAGGAGAAHGDGRLQHGAHGPYLQMVPLSRMVALPSEQGTGTRTANGGTAGVNNSGGGGAGTGEQLDQNRSHLAMLPAFRHWESQRARLRIQVRFVHRRSSLFGGRLSYCSRS